MIPLSLYIHWPFCKSKCPYCDFNSHVRDSIDEKRWQQALLKELSYWAERTQGRVLTSIFFGGGTPSLMRPETVASLIFSARHFWHPHSDLEVTLEANPTSVEADKLAAFGQAGVNRISMGLQALRGADLNALGRQHSVEEARKALDIACSLFERVSFDLIYARRDQTETEWAEELHEALAFGTSHLSLYQLTIEPGTNFEARVSAGERLTPDEERAARLYELTQEICEAHGLPAYEVSNHARPGYECRHNLAYWRYHDYVGIGPGAHGRVTLGEVKHATRTHRAPEIWLERVEADGHALTDCQPLDPKEAEEERLLMGLRLAEGITWTPRPEQQAKALRLAQHGLVEVGEGWLKVKPAGRLCLNRIVLELAGG